ncbi:hypothetical protein F5Y10DRAFT_59260 [Nemania abortiva]|nr:hypothetical protein F5Y10DRAFT_59260 [Nemania abortiva]
MNSTGTPNHTGHDDTTNSANPALRGAFLAFQKTTAKPTTNRPSMPTPALTPTRDANNGNGNGYGYGNGALMAATSASREHSLSRSPSRLAIGQSNALTPVKSPTGDARSPSLIAATLAASRTGSPSPKPASPMHTNAYQAARERRKVNVGEDSAVSSLADVDTTTDSSSIGPTNALISLFEQKGEEDTDPVKKSPAVSSFKKALKTGLRPMTPPRAMSPVVAYETSPSVLASSFAWEKAVLSSPPSAGRDVGRVKSPLRSVRDAEQSPSTTLIKPTKKPRPITPPPRGIGRADTVILSPQPRQTSSHKIVTDSSDTVAGSVTPPPTKPSKKRQSQTSRAGPPPVAPVVGEEGVGALVRRSSSSLSDDTFVSASSAPSPAPSPQPSSPVRQSPRHQTLDASRPSRPLLRHSISIPLPPRPHVLQTSSNSRLDSLTNAIVAGSLASARATPTTTKPPTPPPPRKQTPHMRQTLRVPRSMSEEELTGAKSPHKTKPLGKLSSRKKHAHHEGARKRWREEITAHERQRYEGVWASNRGLLLDGLNAAANGLRDIDTSQLVANVVVRDIWTRSRLPVDELAEVWDLVDTQGKGALDKSQFVVGMWLIDQRLRGRKIPRKVSDSVWGSAKGVRVLGPKVKR